MPGARYLLSVYSLLLYRRFARISLRMEEVDG